MSGIIRLLESLVTAPVTNVTVDYTEAARLSVVY